MGIKTIFLFLERSRSATLFFYTDKDFRSIIREHSLRYIYFPIFITLLTGFLFTFPQLTPFILLAYWSWQAFHYGRQNWGMYAFASIAETRKAPRVEERIAIDAGTLLAIVGTFKILGTQVAPVSFHRTFDYLYQIGFITFVAVLILSIVVYAKLFKQTTFLKTIFFFTAVFFFLPIFLSTDNNVAFLSYAMAHGLQYIVFMTVISATTSGEPRRTLPYSSLVKLMAILLIVALPSGVLVTCGKWWSSKRAGSIRGQRIFFSELFSEPPCRTSLSTQAHGV
jgi:hypothetical protein